MKKNIKKVIESCDKLLKKEGITAEQRKKLEAKKKEMENILAKIKGSKLTEIVNKEEAVERTFKAAEEVLDGQTDAFNPELDEDVEFMSDLVKKLIQKFEEKYVIKGSIKVKANYAELKEELKEDIIDEAKNIKEDNPNICYRDLALHLMDIPEFEEYLEDVIGNEFDVEQWIEDKLETEED